MKKHQEAEISCCLGMGDSLVHCRSTFQSTNWAKDTDECLHDLKSLTGMSADKDKSGHSKACVHHASGRSSLVVSKFEFKQVR